MGCSDSKSTATNNTSNQPSNQDKRGSRNSQGSFITVEEACQYIIDELDISKEKAAKLVRKIDTNGDGKIARSDLEDIKQRIAGAKSEIEPMFKDADPDGDGHVSLEDGAKILAKKFPLMPPETLQRIAARFDSSNDGTFQYGEFVLFYSHCKAKQNRLKELFDKLDADNSGTLDRNEVTEVLVRECDVEPKEAECLMEQADKDKDGSLDKNEFEHMWNSMFGVAT